MRHFLLTLLSACIAVTASAQVSFGEPQLFNDDWTFILDDNPSYSAADFDNAKWRSLSLPHDWSVEAHMSPSLFSCTGYLPGGIGWYRKQFNISDTSKRHYIYFEGVYNRSDVYINGTLLGHRPNGYISFMYDLTPYLQKGDNTIAVRVDHSKQADSRWYTGSGIYRDVYLIQSGHLHISQWGVSYHASSFDGDDVEMTINVDLDNTTSKNEKLVIKNTLYDAYGKKVAATSSPLSASANDTSTLTTALNVKNATRWSLEYPHLYTLKTEVLKGGRTIDKTSTSVGLRQLEFTPNHGFALNGISTKAKGVCIHHDAGVLGAVVPEDVWRRRLQNLKNLGVNAIRMSHNPQAPIVYHLCDELGLLVMDEAFDEWEFPKRKWLEGWNKGTPGFEGTFDFFEEWSSRDVADMVRRDRNHPSIFLWSIGNEVDYPNDPYSHPVLDGGGESGFTQPAYGGYQKDQPNAERIGMIGQRLADEVRAIDTSRPTTGALAGVVMSNATTYPEAIDVVGYNYTEARYKTDHERYPNRIIYGSENRSDYKAWTHVRDNDFIFGQFIWTGTDYLGESGRWPSRGLGTGLLDFASFTKPRGAFRASLWSDSPTTYIGTYIDNPQKSRISIDANDNWNYTDGQTVRVVCYTNAAYAKLLMNGVEVGELKPYDMETGVIYWDIPFAPGTLTAQGYSDDKATLESSYAIQTSGRPFAITASVDKETIGTGGRIAHVTVTIVDDNGVHVKLADNQITCRVKGAGSLLALENGSNSETSYAKAAQRRVAKGQLLAYITSADSAGEIEVTFTSPLLQPTTLKLNVQ